MSKLYPIEIENVGDDKYIVMSRGDHDPHEFMKKIREEGFDWPLGMPTHRWVKLTPARDGVHSAWYRFVIKGTRGAFPATYAHESYGDERYEVAADAALQAEGVAE